jgi:hypothetical protein
VFFSISHAQKDNFTDHYRFGKFFVSLDSGWQLTKIDNKSILYKGYADTASLDSLLEKIVEQQEPTFTGNFCALVYYPETKEIKIKTDIWRSFPIYIDKNNEVTNLIRHPYIAWTDSIITVDEQLNFIETKCDIIGEIINDPISEEDGLSIINNLLTEKTKTFLAHNTKPIKSFLSGGVDSILVYSYLKKLTGNVEVVVGEHIDWDRFYMKNRNDITSFWGYKQYHHWLNDTILTSGAPGDEFTLRSPTTASLYVMNRENGKAIPDLNIDPDNMHYTYFRRDKHLKIFEELTANAEECISWSYKNLVWEICNNMLNDWQHWHLGKTISWTPLRDLNITKTILRMPHNVIVKQILNSDISINLIERNVPGLGGAISSQKNSFNDLSNLYDYYADNSII